MITIAYSRILAYFYVFLRTSDNIWGSLYAISPYLFHTSSQFIHSNLETLFFSKSYNSFIPDIYTASLHETYSKALSVQLVATAKEKRLRGLQKEDTLFRAVNAT